jgi:dTDP-glucose 4,6-dehydratase
LTISRCSNNYGPYHFPEKLIPLVISKALNNQAIPIYGKGENIRDWLYVDDHCEAIDIIIKKGNIGEVYNIGGHNEKTNLEVVKLILNYLNKPETLISYVKDRAGHDLRYAIDPTKISKELGWLPKTNFEAGIKVTIDWYIHNQDWLSSVISGEYLDFYKKNYKDFLS